MRQKISGIVLLLLLAAVLPLHAAAAPATELLATGHIDDAIGVLQNHLQSFPQDGNAYVTLLRAYLALQNWDSAVDAGQRAVALDPNNSEYHLWLGRAYGEKAEHASWVTALSLARKTRLEFERAVALNSGSIGARSDLAEYYVEAPGFLGGSKDKAAAQADMISRLGNQAAAHWVRAKVAEADKNYALAEQELQTAIQVSRGNPSTMLDLASFYRRQGRLQDAESMVSRAVQAATNAQYPKILYEGAELLYAAGRNFTGALEMLRSCISAGGRSDEAPLFRAYYLMGNILEKMGNRPAAAAQYRAALSLAGSFEPAQTALKRVQ